MSEYHYPFVDELEKPDYIFPDYLGKKIFYTDILYNMTGRYDFSDVIEKHKTALYSLDKAVYDIRWKPYFDYAKLIFEITIEKMKLIPVLNEYLEGEISKIEELEYDFIEETKNVYSHGKNVAFYNNLKSTGV